MAKGGINRLIIMDNWSCLLVFLGGGAGSVLRFWLSKVILVELEPLFPLGTFTVNIVGCFLIGIFMGLILRHQMNPSLGLFLTTGFCGGFTTFSTFMYENNRLVNETDFYLAFSYTVLSIVIGFAATFGGIAIAKMF
jgi:CrcB protein